MEAGIGRYLNPYQITSQRLLFEIKSVLSNYSHKENIEMFSLAFRNGSIDPLKNALFWIEHVLKFNSANFFVPPKNYVGWFEYLYFDFICIFYTFYKIFGYFVKKIFGAFARCFRRCFSSPGQVVKNKELKKKKKK